MTQEVTAKHGKEIVCQEMTGLLSVASGRAKDSRRLENKDGHDQKHPAKAEILERWKNVRRDKILLMRACNWYELTPSKISKVDKEGKEMRTEIVRNKKKKYGKAGNSMLTTLEDASVTGQTGKWRELAEIEKNLTLHKQVPKGWTFSKETSDNVPEGRKSETGRMKMMKDEWSQKEIENLWDRMKREVMILKKGEQWLNATRMDNTSLEEQRDILDSVQVETRSVTEKVNEYERCHQQQTNDAQDIQLRYCKDA